MRREQEGISMSTPVLRPLHRPVEIWQPMVSGCPRGIDFMVRHGIKGIISPTSGPQLDRWIHLYRGTATQYGNEER
jgi:hypothetical protein